MSGQRKPKRRKRPEKMCWTCGNWYPHALDWGECFWMAEAVPGDEYRSTYAYAECCFDPPLHKEAV